MQEQCLKSVSLDQGLLPASQDLQQPLQGALALKLKSNPTDKGAQRPSPTHSVSGQVVSSVNLNFVTLM